MPDNWRPESRVGDAKVGHEGLVRSLIRVRQRAFPSLSMGDVLGANHTHSISLKIPREKIVKASV